MTGQIAHEKYKQALRAEMLGRREKCSPTAARVASEKVCGRLETFGSLAAAQQLAGYAAVRGEIDTEEYLRARLAGGARVYLPRVEGPGALVFVGVDESWDLHPGGFGIPEPAGQPGISHEIDVFLVPGVAFDRRGNRLGFGGGFYDRALGSIRANRRAVAAGRALFVGVCYHWQLVDPPLLVDEHDIAMNVIITDQTLFWADGG